MELAELLERVKAATGPDPALDGRIFAALFGGVASQDCSDSTRRSYSGQAYFTNVDRPCVLIEDTHHAEPVTASLDAALALVERVLPRWEFALSAEYPDDQCGDAISRCSLGDPLMGFDAEAPTPALAILAAALEALTYLRRPNAHSDVGSARPERTK